MLFYVQDKLRKKEILTQVDRVEIIRAMYKDMCNYTYTPTHTQYCDAIHALMNISQSIQKSVPKAGMDPVDFWKTRLSDKFRNSRRRELKNTEEVQAKKIKRAEKDSPLVWGIPNLKPPRPEGEDDKSIITMEFWMKDESRRSKQNFSKISIMMDRTFPDRRKYIIDDCPGVSEIKEKYPCLFDEDELAEEYKRLTTYDLASSMLSEMHVYAGQIIKHTPPKTAHLKEGKRSISSANHESNRSFAESAAAMVLLPSQFKENIDYIIICGSNDRPGDAGDSPYIECDGEIFGATEFTVYAENEEICNATDLFHGFMMMACYYTFNMAYPSRIVNTLTFMQRVLLKINDSAKKDKAAKKIASLLKRIA